MSNRGNSPLVWTLDEIERLPEFGNDSGWFYGMVRNHETGKVRLCEILPGLGYTNPWPMWHPKSWWWALNDVRHTSLRKSRLLSGI